MHNHQLTELVASSMERAFNTWLEDNRGEILDRLAARVSNHPSATAPAPPELGQPRKPFLTPHQLAERWHWHPESIRRMCRQGRMTCMLVGRRIRIPIEAVEQFERESTIGRR